MKASMQKLIAMGLCVVLAVGSLTGCGGSSNDAGSASGDGAKTSSSSDKKTFSDLGGMDITVGDWFTSKDTLADRTDEFGKKQNEYWKSIQEKYNFKITRDSVYSYTDAKSDYVNDVMASSPKYELYYLYQEFVSEPLMKGLMYDLSTLPEFNFDEEKWNPTVKELMSIGDGIWGMSPDNEPRGGIFFNKRLFKEAGIPEDEPYDLQKKNSGHGTSSKSIVRNLQRIPMVMVKQTNMLWQVSQNTICQCVQLTTMQHLYPVIKTVNTLMQLHPKSSKML